MNFIPTSTCAVGTDKLKILADCDNPRSIPNPAGFKLSDRKSLSPAITHVIFSTLMGVALYFSAINYNPAWIIPTVKMLIYIFVGAALIIGLLMLTLNIIMSIQLRRAKIEPVDENDLKRRAALHPPPFPNSWFKLCNSDELSKSTVKEINVLGLQIALFRGTDGTASALHAYCPHLGANMACDGRVVDNTLQCPFHAWRFDKDGQCVDIPYAKKVPKFARTEKYEIREIWGMILVWYHCDGLEPTWEPKPLPELLPEMNYKFCWKSKSIVNIHLQDFCENGVDWAHFDPVHGEVYNPLVNLLFKAVHNTTWTGGTGDDSHMGYFKNNAELAWKSTGTIIPDAGAKASCTFHGPGVGVFRFLTRYGDVMMIKTFTPLGPLKLQMEDVVYCSRKTWMLLVKYIIVEANVQFTADINIWSKKSYSNKPMVLKEDGNILGHRRWYNQFYSKNSRRGIDLSW